MLIGVVAAAVTAVAMVVLIGRLAGFSKVRDVLAEAHPEWLIVCVLGQMLVFAGYAGAFRWTVRADDGPTVALGLSIRVVLASFAATQVFSFAGIGGLAVMYLVLRRYERDAQAAAVRLIGLNTAVYLVFGVIGWFAAAVALAHRRCAARHDCSVADRHPDRAVGGEVVQRSKSRHTVDRGAIRRDPSSARNWRRRDSVGSSPTHRHRLTAAVLLGRVLLDR